MNHRSAVDIGILEALCKAMEASALTEEILHHVPSLVHLRVVFDLRDAIPLWQRSPRSCHGLAIERASRCHQVPDLLGHAAPNRFEIVIVAVMRIECEVPTDLRGCGGCKGTGDR